MSEGSADPRRTISRPTVNPWFVAMAMSIATFMEVLDTSIANVALRYIAGGLSAANNDSEWVITSYLAANAAVQDLSRRLLSIAGIAQGLPGDFAEQHDHYIHGTPKR